MDYQAIYGKKETTDPEKIRSIDARIRVYSEWIANPSTAPAKSSSQPAIPSSIEGQAHFFAYHNGPELRSDYEISGGGRASFYCSGRRRSVAERALGCMVWVVSRKIVDGKRYLDGAYIADEISDMDDGSINCSGPVKIVFDPPVLLSEMPWYDKLRRTTASFIGFQKLNPEIAHIFLAIAEAHDEGRAQASTDQQLFREGAIMKKVITFRARSGSVREHCLRHYGPQCQACQIDFAKAFGQDFHNLIEVHHLHPVANYLEETEIDPVEDCAPLCPNCHRMAHYKTPISRPRTITELRDLQKTRS